MFAASTFAALMAVAAPLLVRADVTPNEPGPGDVFNIGSPCIIKWTGDADSTTAWKNMNIELMTGSDLGQLHITTVAQNQDGTVDGTFSYTCPEVTPTSAIYFYQFTSPDTSSVTWTTRFTIASSTGQTTPPPNATQPGTDKAIPWGIGALVDPSKAVPPPTRGTSNPGSTNSTGTGPTGPTGTTGTTGTTGNTPASSSSSPAVKNPPSDQSLAVSATSDASGSAVSAKPTSAASTLGFDNRVWLSVGAFVFAALVW